MIERNHHFGRLKLDRDAIVRAALRAYVEAVLAGYPLHFPSLVDAVSFYPIRVG
jgi:hypothetical protein